jgi:hypothetical protein
MRAHGTLIAGALRGDPGRRVREEARETKKGLDHRRARDRAARDDEALPPGLRHVRQQQRRRPALNSDGIAFATLTYAMSTATVNG